MITVEKWFGIGFVVGALFMLVVWILFAYAIEGDKVDKGYLTYGNKTYTIELYDELSKPESKSEK